MQQAFPGQCLSMQLDIDNTSCILNGLSSEAPNELGFSGVWWCLPVFLVCETGSQSVLSVAKDARGLLILLLLVLSWDYRCRAPTLSYVGN